MRQRLKTKLRIQSVSVSRSQQKPPQSLQVGMPNDSTHEQLGYASAAMLGHNKDIRNMRESCKI
jgi:hypothetical protein